MAISLGKSFWLALAFIPVLATFGKRRIPQSRIPVSVYSPGVPELRERNIRYLSGHQGGQAVRVMAEIKGKGKGRKDVFAVAVARPWSRSRSRLSDSSCNGFIRIYV